jgi:hypothetical protein
MSEAFRAKVWRIAQEIGTPLMASSRPYGKVPTARA